MNLKDNFDLDKVEFTVSELEMPYEELGIIGVWVYLIVHGKKLKWLLTERIVNERL